MNKAVESLFASEEPFKSVLALSLLAGNFHQNEY